MKQHINLAVAKLRAALENGATCFVNAESCGAPSSPLHEWTVTMNLTTHRGTRILFQASKGSQQ